MYFMMQPPTPEEQELALAEQTALNIAHEEVIEGFTEEQLLGVIRMLRQSVQDEAYGNYLAGKMQGRLRYEFNLCQCSLPWHKRQDHSDPNFITKLVQSEQTDDESHPVQPLRSMEERLGLQGVIDQAAMDEYNLEWKEWDDHDPTLHCKGCDMQYQSLEDRMLKRPGVAGCDGCQQSAKWGDTKDPWGEK